MIVHVLPNGADKRYKMEIGLWIYTSWLTYFRTRPHNTPFYEFEGTEGTNFHYN